LITSVTIGSTVRSVQYVTMFRYKHDKVIYRDTWRILTTRSQAVVRIANRTALQQTLVISDCCKIASPAVFEILGPKRIGAYWSHDLDLSGSRDVIGHVTIRFFIGHFLIAFSNIFSVRRIVYPQYVTDRRQTDGHSTVS